MIATIIQFAEPVGVVTHRDCERDDSVNELYHWELHSLLAQLNHRHLFSQHGKTTLAFSTPELQAPEIATQLHIHHLIRELVYLNRFLDLPMVGTVSRQSSGGSARRIREIDHLLDGPSPEDFDCFPQCADDLVII